MHLLLHSPVIGSHCFALASSGRQIVPSVPPRWRCEHGPSPWASSPASPGPDQSHGISPVSGGPFKPEETQSKILR
ncbi:hypothetical protein TNCV_3305341 [Trichonephila clavipes]|nr:hypothetical protein TNCV_3305341 [Trichonephila clavipes]